MDESVLKLTSPDFSANSPNPTVGLDASIATLHQAENQVRGVVSRRFDEAVKDEDLASIERFFKIFLSSTCTRKVSRTSPSTSAPSWSIRVKRTSSKLWIFSRGIRELKSSLLTLTLLFEGVARTVDIHQPLIETYYGPGRLVTVFGMLQVSVVNLSSLKSSG